MALTRDLKGTSLPLSVPPIVRRANLMLGTRPALHTVLGLFAVFLRDNINRLTISGIMLPVVALVDDTGRLDGIRETHTNTMLRARSRSVRFIFVVIFGTATYPPGTDLS